MVIFRVQIASPIVHSAVVVNSADQVFAKEILKFVLDLLRVLGFDASSFHQLPFGAGTLAVAVDYVEDLATNFRRTKIPGPPLYALFVIPR
jgi:hypothetical protein